MSAEEANRKESLASCVLAALERLAPGAGTATAFWVPGRIEFLGKHTDYAGGRSLVCAVERGFVIAACPRMDAIIRVHDAASGESAQLSLSADAHAPRGHWSNYPAVVARRVARNFPGAHTGADITFASDLPRASGMSSSSALVVGMFLVLAAVNDLAGRAEYRAAIHSNEDLAAYLGTVENGMSFGTLAGEAGVGTFGGSEDHAAILGTTPAMLTQFAFCPLRTERVVPLPDGHVFVIASSGVVAEKTGAALEKYNRTSRRASEALDWMRRTTGVEYPTLAAAVAKRAATDPIFHGMPRAIRSRVEQFMFESDIIVPAAADALARGDLATLGVLVDSSQHAAESLLGNQVVETVFLARSARESGAAAASAFGAGFGGSVWALVAEREADAFRERWAAAYGRAFPMHSTAAEFFVTRAGPHARALAPHA